GPEPGREEQFGHGEEDARAEEQDGTQKGVPRPERAAAAQALPGEEAGPEQDQGEELVVRAEPQLPGVEDEQGEGTEQQTGGGREREYPPRPGGGAAAHGRQGERVDGGHGSLAVPGVGRWWWRGRRPAAQGRADAWYRRRCSAARSGRPRLS